MAEKTGHAMNAIWFGVNYLRLVRNICFLPTRREVVLLAPRIRIYRVCFACVFALLPCVVIRLYSCSLGGDNVTSRCGWRPASPYPAHPNLHVSDRYVPHERNPSSKPVSLPLYLRSCCVALQMLRVFPNVCILRVRMPISDDLSPRNFVTKIVKYDKV